MRLLVLDLDGTALRVDHSLHPADIAAAQALRAHGVHLSIATGRISTGARWVADALEMRGIIAVMNGSALVHAPSGMAVRSYGLSQPLLQRLHGLLEPDTLHPFVFQLNTLHYRAQDTRFAPYLKSWTDELVPHTQLLDAPAWQEDVLAAGLVGPRNELEALIEALAPEDPVGVTYFKTYEDEAFCLLRDHRATKGSALAELADAHGCTVEETVAVGDWLNDLSMLQAAGQSFAMGGSAPEVCEAADDVLLAKRFKGGAIVEVANRVWGL